MAELTEEEIEVLSKPLCDIRYQDHKNLLSALDKLEEAGKPAELLRCKEALANAFERSRIPHDEKARHWLAAAQEAGAQDTNSAGFLKAAADHLAGDGAPNRAAPLFENAAEKAIYEGASEEQVRGLLRESRRMYELSGHGSEAGRVFRRENDYALQVSNWLTKLWMLFFKGVSAYGESPGRVALVSGAVILLCTVIYGLAGLQPSQQVPPTYSFSTSVYFSVVTFTTLGYGDFAPYGSVSRITATSEAIAGLFLMSLFLVTLVRRFGRP